MLYAKSHNITSAPAFAGAFFNLSSSFSSQCHLSHRERQVFPHRRTIPMIPRLLLEEKLSAKPTDEVQIQVSSDTLLIFYNRLTSSAPSGRLPLEGKAL